MRQVELIALQAGVTPRWRAREKRRRQVVVLRLQAGLSDPSPPPSPRAAGRPRGRPEPIDVRPLFAAQETARRRMKALGLTPFLLPRGSGIR